MAAVNFGDPFGHVVEEVPIVRDRDDGAGVALQVLLEPQHRFCVEVVGRLVEEQQVGLLEQKLAQCHAATFTTGEHGDVCVRRRAAQRVHRLLELGVEVPGISGVDGLLQLAHFVHQSVEVGVRVRHLLGDGIEPVDLRLDLADAFFDVAEDGLLFVQGRFLHEDAHGVSGAEPSFAVGRLLDSRHDLQDR